MRNFFISYNKADGAWAEWIAWQLEEAGYTTILQAWDFRPSENFVIKLNEAIRDSERTVAVLSPDYERAFFTLPEWAAAFAQDPTGDKGVLLPVRVRECALTGLFKQIIYVDLVGKDEAQARRALLSGIQRERAKPLTKPEFPGNIPRSVLEHPSYPGPTAKKFPAKAPAALALFLAFVGVVYASWPRPFSRLLTPTPQPCPRAGAEVQHYEAEDAEISGGASRDSEHSGFSGDAYVSGYGIQPEAGTTFEVDVPSDGQYRVDLCYANATNSAKTLTLFVNGEPFRQARLPNAPRWDTWLTHTEVLPLSAGRNTVGYRKTPADNGQVNLDFIRVGREPAGPAWPPPAATPAPTPRPDTGRPKPSRPQRVRCSAEGRLLGRC